MTASLEFEGELIVPTINLSAYRRIYTLEGWMRRVCLTAWMASFGNEWTTQISPGLRASLETRSTRNKKRLYLGAETSADLIWETTLSELSQLLSDATVKNKVTRLTGVAPTFLASKLEEIRDIRNVIAHSRALSARTETILEGLMASIEIAVETFKNEVIYKTISEAVFDKSWVTEYIEEETRGADHSQFQPYAAQRLDIIELVSLPVERSHNWPDARKLLRSFGSHLHAIIAFCLNKTGDEFLILVPACTPEPEMLALCDTFVENPYVWTDVTFVEQNPRYICQPKVWFYENNAPDDPW